MKKKFFNQINIWSSFSYDLNKDANQFYSQVVPRSGEIAPDLGKKYSIFPQIWGNEKTVSWDLLVKFFSPILEFFFINGVYNSPVLTLSNYSFIGRL